MNIVFDLDGTLIDSKPRLYQLFQSLAPESQLSFDEYWDHKQNKTSNETLLRTQLGYRQPAIDHFVGQWMEKIESRDFLELDVNLPGMHARLADLSEHAHLHVCTARQLRQPVLEQLERLSLLPFFQNILVTGQRDSKESLIARHVPGLGVLDWMVGDTGKDIQVGKLLNLRTCAVLTGFLSRASLEPYAPDLILATAAQFDPAAAQCTGRA